MQTDLASSSGWRDLLRHREEMGRISLPNIILGDPDRLEQCELTLEGLRLNFALNHATPKTIELLVRLAQQRNVENWRARMFRGETINATENRAVLHTALRQRTGQPVLVDGRDIIPEVIATRQRMKKFVADMREGRWKGSTGKAIRHIVNIGIGGSDLGPRLAVRALDPYTSGPHTHFVANLDAFDILSTLKDLDPAETLFVVVSKTFTTQETLRNAQTARRWLVDKLGEAAIKQHFVAVSANLAEAGTFGIPAVNIFPMWDWVGGRFSLWSAVGLSAALALGMDNFESMLDGAATMDEHFCAAPLARNLPVVLALLGIWQRNFWGRGACAVLPYSERLRDLPRYLQQLEMESNGKTATRDGQPVNYATAPVIFGECGTVGQHSFHQWLHQGSDIVPVDFIGVRTDDLNHPEHHRTLLANLTAQAAALAFGKTETGPQYGAHAGGRPSNLIMVDRLDPYHFGMLLALYEHKVFVQGIVWSINSFDQPGVELGKKLVKSLEAKTSPKEPRGVFLRNFWNRISSS